MQKQTDEDNWGPHFNRKVFLGMAETLFALERLANQRTIFEHACDPHCPGWLVAIVNKPWERQIERCLDCKRYPNDEDAAFHVIEELGRMYLLPAGRGEFTDADRYTLLMQMAMPWWKEPELGYEVDRTLVLSTQHMTEEDNAFLELAEETEHEEAPSVVATYNNGFIVMADKEWLEGAKEGAHVVGFGLSLAFVKAIDFAVRRGYNFVRFDSDGPAIKELEVHEW